MHAFLIRTQSKSSSPPQAQSKTCQSFGRPLRFPDRLCDTFDFEISSFFCLSCCSSVGMVATTFTAIRLSPVFRAVRRKPPELATRSRFPLFDALGGSNTAIVITSNPFLSFAFMFPPRFCLVPDHIFIKSFTCWPVRFVPQATPELPEAKTGDISRPAVRRAIYRTLTSDKVFL
jgi:hypothetical protein